MTKISSLFQDNYVEYEKFLTDLGAEQLGSGICSSVFRFSGSNKVVKVSHRLDGWVDFGIIIMMNGWTDSVFPRIYSINVRDTWYVALLEYIPKTIKQVKIEESSRPTFEKKDSSQRVLELYDKVKSYTQWNKLDGCSNIDEIETKKSLTKLYDVFSDKVTWDMHDGNWMVRDNGALVLIDPIFYRFNKSEVNNKKFTSGSRSLSEVKSYY